jgi:DNA polymerase-1
MTKLIGLDYETTGFNPYKGDRIFAFSLTTEEVETTVHRLDWISGVKRRAAIKNLAKIHTPQYTKVAHNAKFEMGFTAMYYNGELPKSEWHDTMIMSQLLRNLLKSHSLENLAKRYFEEDFPDEAEEWAHWDKQVKLHMTKQKRLMNNYPQRVEKEIHQPMYDAGVEPLVLDRPNYGLIPVDIMNPYEEADGDRCMLLWRLMWPKLLEDKALYQDYLNEMRLIHTTQRMEQVGMMVHEKNARKLYRDLSDKLKKLEIEKKKIFGFEINLDSSDQLQKHLFGYINRKKHEKKNEEWKKREPRFRMTSQLNTDSGTPSASKEALEKLQEAYPDNPAVDLLSQWRAFSRGRTMAASYMELAGKDMIVHADIQTNEAATGRESVRKPSLQNVQKEFSIKSKYGIPARRCFRPRPGYVYFLGDYSGIEMRMIINAAGEQVLIDKLKEDNDFDVHSFNGEVMLVDEWRELFATDDKRAKKALRDRIKDTGFAIPYGAGIPKLCVSLKRKTQEVKEILMRYREVCPNICTFNRTKMDEVRKQGYITSAFGRKLSIWRDKAYTAANYQIQGDAAGTFKRGQNNIDTYLREVWDYKIRMILPVHDEIIIEFPRELLHDYAAILHDLNWCMINIPEIKVPLMTEWKIAKTNWQDAEGIEI